jgi:hypothetical protein
MNSKTAGLSHLFHANWNGEFNGLCGRRALSRPKRRAGARKALDARLAGGTEWPQVTNQLNGLSGFIGVIEAHSSDGAIALAHGTSAPSSYQPSNRSLRPPARLNVRSGKSTRGSIAVCRVDDAIPLRATGAARPPEWGQRPDRVVHPRLLSATR